MKFPAKASVDFAIAPAGNHVAICNGVIDLGLQPGRGMYPEPKHEVYLRFELPTEQVTYQKDGRDITGPMSIGRTFTASMSEKANLRKFIESWFGKKFPNDEAASDFDLKAILSRKCLLNVTHSEKNGKTYANINNATPIPKGMSAEHSQANPSIYYSLDEPNPQTYNALPEWLRKKIDERITQTKSAEREYETAGGHDEFNDDIPF